MHYTIECAAMNDAEFDYFNIKVFISKNIYKEKN